MGVRWRLWGDADGSDRWGWVAGGGDRLRLRHRRLMTTPTGTRPAGRPGSPAHPVPGTPNPHQFITVISLHDTAVPIAAWCAGANTPMPSAAALRDEVIRLLHPPTLGVSPSTGTALINLRTLFWVNTTTQLNLGRAALIGFPVELRVTYDRTEFDFGDTPPPPSHHPRHRLRPGPRLRPLHRPVRPRLHHTAARSPSPPAPTGTPNSASAPPALDRHPRRGHRHPTLTNRPHHQAIPQHPHRTTLSDARAHSADPRAGVGFRVASSTLHPGPSGLEGPNVTFVLTVAALAGVSRAGPASP